MTADHQALLATIASHGLAGASTRAPSAPLDVRAWHELLRAVRFQRLAGHLVHALCDGAVPATDGQYAQAADLHIHAMQQVLRLERHMIDTVATLRSAGVAALVLKGPSLAHTAYPDPGLRVFGDIDVLVPSDAFDDAIAALTALGCERRWPQLRAGFDRRFGKSATLVSPAGHEIDLHRTLTVGPFGLTVDLPGLFETATTFTLGGQRLPTLAPEERFLLACYHAALGNYPPRYVALRDIAQLLLTTDLDLDRVMALARDWAGEPAVARAVTLTWDTFDLADVLSLSVWAQRYVPDRRERRALAGYLKPQRGSVPMALSSLRVIRGVGAKCAYASALLLPDRQALHYYERGYGRWWRRGARTLVRGGHL